MIARRGPVVGPRVLASLLLPPGADAATAGSVGRAGVPVRCRRVLPLLDNTTEAFAADPHGVLRAAREESWIVRTPGGLGVLTYAACNAVLLHPGFRPGVFELMRRASGGGP